MRFTLARRLAAPLAIATLAVAMAGCGSSTSDRAISGAGIGAGLGAATGAVTGGSAIGGALLGGAAGAAAGGLTNQEDIDLGRPVWRR